MVVTENEVSLDGEENPREETRILGFSVMFSKCVKSADPHIYNVVEIPAQGHTIKFVIKSRTCKRLSKLYSTSNTFVVSNDYSLY